MPITVPISESLIPSTTVRCITARCRGASLPSVRSTSRAWWADSGAGSESSGRPPGSGTAGRSGPGGSTGGRGCAAPSPGRLPARPGSPACSRPRPGRPAPRPRRRRPPAANGRMGRDGSSAAPRGSRTRRVTLLRPPHQAGVGVLHVKRSLSRSGNRALDHSESSNSESASSDRRTRNLPFHRAPFRVPVV